MSVLVLANFWQSWVNLCWWKWHILAKGPKHNWFFLKIHLKQACSFPYALSPLLPPISVIQYILSILGFSRYCDVQGLELKEITQKDLSFWKKRASCESQSLFNCLISLSESILTSRKNSNRYIKWITMKGEKKS